MQLYSTNDTHHQHAYSFQEAVFTSLPADNGLFMPAAFPRLPDRFFEQVETYSFPEIAFTVAQTLLDGEIPDNALHEIIDDAINFEAPLVTLDEQTHVLELFHGPTLAFKDFGGAVYGPGDVILFAEKSARERRQHPGSHFGRYGRSGGARVSGSARHSCYLALSQRTGEQAARTATYHRGP